MIAAFTLLFILTSAMHASANEASDISISDLRSQVLSDAKTLETLNAEFQSYSASLDLSDFDSLKLALLYANRLNLLADRKSADDYVDGLLDSLKSSYGEESFQFLYASIEQISLGDNTSFQEYLAANKRAWRGVKNFGEEVETKEQLIELFALLQQVNGKGAYGVHKGTISSMAKTLFSKSERLLKTIPQEKLIFDVYAARLFFLADRRKNGVELLQSVAQELDASEVDEQFTLSLRKRLIMHFVNNDMPQDADKQVLAIAEDTRLLVKDQDIEHVFRVDPRYPVAAARAGAIGEVLLNYKVNTLGNTQDIKIVNVEGHSSFGPSAMRALSRWRYIPKIENGEFIMSEEKSIRLDFTLQN
jgi:TonB family protein